MSDFDVDRPRCPYCQGTVSPEEQQRRCPICARAHHEVCWGERGGCSACAGQGSSGAATGSEAATGGAPAPGEAVAAILALARGGKKIEAIRDYRALYGVGLKEAKDAVEGLMAGAAPTPPPARLPVTSLGDVVDLALQADLRALPLIAAIKLYRERTGAGLKEAKDAVEAFRRGEPLAGYSSAVGSDEGEDGDGDGDEWGEAPPGPPTLFPIALALGILVALGVIVLVLLAAA